MTCRPYVVTFGVKLCPFTNLLTISGTNITSSRYNTSSMLFFFLWRCGPTRAMASSLTRCIDHTTTHHTRYDSSGRVISSSQTLLPDNTQHLQETDTLALGGIRTHNLSRPAAADLRLRSRCHWDQH